MNKNSNKGEIIMLIAVVIAQIPSKISYRIEKNRNMLYIFLNYIACF